MNDTMQFSPNPLANLMGGSDRVTSTPIPVWDHRIRLTGPVVDTTDYREELNLLETMSEHDQATIVINTEGGSLQTTLEFVSAIEGCQGLVKGYLAGEAHSAGSVIFLKCHTFELSRYAQMMIHAPSGGFLGKFSDTFRELDHFRKWVEFFYRDIYTGFLTEEEIVSVLNGSDIWLDAEQIHERLDNLIEYRQEKALKDLEGSEDPEDVSLREQLLAMKEEEA